MDFKALLGGGEEASVGAGLAGRATSVAIGMSGDKGCLPSLTVKQRVVGFVVCFSIGMILSFISTIFLFQPVKFAVIYTIGNVLSLLSMGFLVGPVKQIKNMFHQKRWLTSLVMLAAFGGTLGVALGTRSVAGTLIMIVVQMLAMLWYTLSWIPYAREAVWKACTSCLK